MITSTDEQANDKAGKGAKKVSLQPKHDLEGILV